MRCDGSASNAEICALSCATQVSNRGRQKCDAVVGPCTLCRRAKEKRERLRSAHLAPDYIPLGGAAGLTATSNQDAAARLRVQQRDAEGSGSEEEPDAEDAVRMQFVGGSRKGGRRQGGPLAQAPSDQVVTTP